MTDERNRFSQPQVSNRRRCGSCRWRGGRWICVLLHGVRTDRGTIAPQLYVDNFSGAQIPLHGPYVLVDAASARLYMIDEGRVQDSMRVIVGKPDTPTPTLKDAINYETFKSLLARSCRSHAVAHTAANVLKLGALVS